VLADGAAALLRLLPDLLDFAELDPAEREPDELSDPDAVPLRVVAVAALLAWAEPGRVYVTPAAASTLARPAAAVTARSRA
jgi:hypothetical protein